MGENGGDRIKGLLSAATAASVYKVQETKMAVAQVRQWAAFNRDRAWRGWIEPEVPKSEAASLAQALSPVLRDFTNPDTGHVGFAAYDTIAGMVMDVTVERLVVDMTGAAAMLGPDRVASAVLGWAEGAPGRYVRTWALRGIELPEALVSVDTGIRFEKLPDRSDHPYFTTLNVSELLNQPVLRFDVMVDPMFYMPEADEEALDRMTRVRNNAVVAPALEKLDLNKLQDALSLVCRSSVMAECEWDDYEDEMLLMRYAGTAGSMMRNVPRFDSRWPDSMPLTADRFAHAITVVGQMEGRSDLDVAVSRWKNSAVALDAANRMIDLRTVLESLYAQDVSQELAFRTALCGAMHLAPATVERTDYYGKLRDFYRMASRVVHGGKHVEDETLVKWCYETCRRAILKRLGEPRKLDWTALMLGLYEGTGEASQT
jgi:hypothetical protein